MCYHLSIAAQYGLIEQTFDAKFEEDFEPIYHADGFTHRALPIITTEAPGMIQQYNWGLIPHWVKSWDDAKILRNQTLNAIGETVFEKPSFRGSISRNRCLVLVDGFYEWRHVGNEKYPYFIYLKDRKPFAFGGIYSHWTDKSTGEIQKSFSILTTPANPLMEKIHNSKKRMPLILPRELQKQWIKQDLMKEEIINLIQPLEAELMEAHTISKLITSRKESSNQIGVMEKYEYPELSLMN